MSHLMAADPAATDSPGLRWLAGDASYYLLAHGDTRVLYHFAIASASSGVTGSATITSTFERSHSLGQALGAMGR